ncbi:MAG TPA: IspD/TarI family cytidylyltransferase [Spirochaetota bacterium]|nr:IspD/TarI family cytidylyltransferase [Spirochaetota bacterium]
MIIAAILAGGKGERVGGTTPKQLLMLGDKPVIQWSVDTFHQDKQIDEIIIVSEKSSLPAIRSIFPEIKYPKITAIIEGGIERVDSSANAVFYKDYKYDDIFMIHDAARPFISTSIIHELINAVKKHDAAGVYIPAKDTIAIVDNEIIDSIPERNRMFYTQTPQAFRYSLIMEAHKSYQLNRARGITDDVSLVASSGHDIHVVSGSDLNFKITTELDYKIANLIAGNILL